MCVKLIDAKRTSNIFSLKDIKCANVALILYYYIQRDRWYVREAFQVIYGIINLNAFGRISITNFLLVSAGSPSMCKGARSLL